MIYTTLGAAFSKRAIVASSAVLTIRIGSIALLSEVESDCSDTDAAEDAWSLRH